MENISSYFNLPTRQSELAFIDVKLDDDNVLFVSPQLIENSASRLTAPMRRLLATYFGNLIHAIATSNRRRAVILLSGVGEPKETRLGYGIDSAKGRSAGPKIKAELINAIWNNQVIQQKCVNKISDLKLFIPNFNMDRISDITTKVLKHYLIDFTQTQCRLHSIPMATVLQKAILNPNTLIWEDKYVELPVYSNGTSDEPIIFVPKDIVLRQVDGNSDMGYFFRFARNYVMDNDIISFQQVPRTGKNNTLLKKDIKASIDNVKEELSKWIVSHPDIMDEYWKASLDRLKTLSDEEIGQVVYNDRGRRAA